jgi:hypothetical protein
VSLCIAAPCRFVNEPCIVFCCDTAGTRGDVQSEDVIKIKEVGECTVLMAGDMSHARELLAACTPALSKYPKCGNDVEVTNLKTELTEAVRLRKRTLANGVLASQFGLSYDEVFNWSQSNPNAWPKPGLQTLRACGWFFVRKALGYNLANEVAIKRSASAIRQANVIPAKRRDLTELKSATRLPGVAPLSVNGSDGPVPAPATS